MHHAPAQAGSRGIRTGHRKAVPTIPWPYPAEAFVPVLKLALPWPGSANAYWQTPRSGPLAGRKVLSRDAKLKRMEALQAVRAQGVPTLRLTGSLAVHVLAQPPTAAKRDLDNIFKPLLDMLVHAGIIEDDSLIDLLSVARFGRDPRPKGKGRVIVMVGLTGYTEGA